ncbi:MAG: nucleotide pyrophosphohydrolase [Sterolibacterium sp.]|nr:nucleotide pyrophosphohydrolase [Sterolibacterium sp.]
MKQDLAASGELCVLRDTLRRFAAARGWPAWHTPKNLAMALIVEAAELVEHFQWLSGEESLALSEEKHAAVREEVADVLIYLIELADVLQIDLYAAVTDKIARNAIKYPAPDGLVESRAGA